MALRGYMGDHEVKVNAVVHDRKATMFRVALAWMSADLPDSNELQHCGWQKIAVPQQAQPPQY
jgi:hypothetical protein